MRSTFNLPPDKVGFKQPIVDSRIGDAYETVKFVRDNFDAIMAIGPGSTRQAEVEGRTGLRGQTVTLTLPANVPMVDVRGSQVTVRDQAFKIWKTSDGHWDEVFQGGQLTFTLKSTAPTDLQNSPIYWVVTYGKAT